MSCCKPKCKCQCVCPPPCVCPAGEIGVAVEGVPQTFTKNNQVPQPIMFGALITASAEWSNPSAGRLQYNGTVSLLMQLHGQFSASNPSVGGVPPAIPGTHGFIAFLLRNGMLVLQSGWATELVTGQGSGMFHTQALLKVDPGDFFEIGMVLDSTFVNGNTADLGVPILDLMAK